MNALHAMAGGLLLLAACSATTPASSHQPKEPVMTQRILIAVTSHDQKGDTGQPTGAYLPEITHPLQVFTKAGFAVDFVSVRGGRVPLDGVDRKDPVNAAFLDDAAAVARLHASAAPAAIDPSKYAAIFFAGGHGTMWDFPDDPTLPELAARIYERGGVVAAVCHGPAGLINIKLTNGTYLVAGKDVAAFTNDEERAAGLAEVVPFLLADKLVERGAHHKPAPNWQKQVITSERLVTGQNPASAAGTAEAVVQLLHAGK